MTRLYRSERDKKVFGICGGLGEVWNVDSNLLRLVVIVTAFFSAGSVILLYLLAALVIPKESDLERRSRAAYPGYGANPPYDGPFQYGYGGPRNGASGPFGGAGTYGAYGAAGPQAGGGAGTYGAAGMGGAAEAHAAAGAYGAEEASRPGRSDLDELMKDVEKKALLKEIEELKAKLAKYEKGEVS